MEGENKEVNGNGGAEKGETGQSVRNAVGVSGDVGVEEVGEEREKEGDTAEMGRDGDGGGKEEERGGGSGKEVDTAGTGGKENTEDGEGVVDERGVTRKH